MSMLESVKNVLTKTAKDAVKASNTAVEYTKLKFKISETKDEIKNKYAKVGELVYKSTLGEVVDSEKLDAVFAEITELIEKSKEYEALLNKTSNKKTCPSCGHGVASDSVFCAQCGNLVDDE